MRPSIEHLLTFSFLQIALASYCGQAAIPFTFQVLHSGLTVLGCAQPQCFGWNANGTRAVQTAQFYRIDGKEDGYLRRSDQMEGSTLRNSFTNPRVAKCEEHYSMKSCASGQWVGGIAPRGSALQIRCCWYGPLLNSEDRGIAMVTNGQLVVGGEVMNDDDFDGFDYIADIKIEKIQNGNTVYAVSIRRMRCVDEEIVKESQISQNAVVFNLDDDTQSIVERQLQVRKPLPKTQQISGTIYAASQPQDSLRKQTHTQLVWSDYASTVTYTPRQDSLNAVAPSYLQSEASISSPSNLQRITQTSHYFAHQTPSRVQAPFDTQFMQQNYIPFQQIAQPQPQQFGRLSNSAVNTIVTPFQSQPAAVPAQPQSEVASIVSTTLLPTFPPLIFPSLDKISKISIPSVEDVENVIPPVQKAILTTVAKFFGVL